MLPKRLLHLLAAVLPATTLVAPALRAGVSRPTPARPPEVREASPVANLDMQLVWRDDQGRDSVIARPHVQVALGSAAQIRVADPGARPDSASTASEWQIELTPIGRTARGWIGELKATSARHGIERKRLVLINQERQVIGLGPCQGRDLELVVSAGPDAPATPVTAVR